MINWIKIQAQYLLPKHLISRLLGLLAEAKAGALTQFLIKTFIKAYKVDMSEAELEHPSRYKTFNEFFTRALKPGIRPINDKKNSLCQPVDGTVSQLGNIEFDSIFQAKGHDFSLTSLLGGKPELAEPFINGKFATIYLAPSDYHRIHMPIAGKLIESLHVPGELFSVNPLTAQNVPELFARNERVVTIFDTPVGKVAMVLVGATIVASIETVWAGTITPPQSKIVRHWNHNDQNITLSKGDEMGRFKLGSTVVLCFEPDAIEFADMNAGDITRLGELFAEYSSADATKNA